MNWSENGADWVKKGTYLGILSEKPQVSALDFVDYLACVHRVVSVGLLTSFQNVSTLR